MGKYFVAIKGKKVNCSKKISIFNLSFCLCSQLVGEYKYS